MEYGTMEIVTFVLSYIERVRYPLLFALFLIEGPWVGFASSMLAAKGQFNIWIIYLMYLFTEIFVDTLLFYMGQRFSKSKVGDKVGNTNHVLLKELKRAAKKNFFIVLTVLKISPLAVPGLIYLGNLKIASTKKLLISTTIVTFITNTAIVYLGYRAGIQWLTFTKVYNYYQIIGGILLALLFITIVLRVYKNEIELMIAKFLKKNVK